MSNALSLYSLEDTLLALLDSAETVDDSQQVAYLQDLAQAHEQALQKRRNVRAFLLWLKAQQVLCKAEADRIADLQRHYANAEKRLENYVVGVIQEFAPEPKKGAKKLECEPGVLSIRKNPDSIEITDEAAVPAEYKVLTIALPAQVWEGLLEPLDEGCRAAVISQIRRSDLSVEKKPIKAAIEAGAEVPGATVRFGEFRLETR
jgi:hypothetical protein